MQTNTTDQFQVEHVEYVSDRPFDDVVAALEKATGDVTDGKFASEIGSAKDKEDFEKRARSFEADSGFMRLCGTSAHRGARFRPGRGQFTKLVIVNGAPRKSVLLIGTP